MTRDNDRDGTRDGTHDGKRENTRGSNRDGRREDRDTTGQPPLSRPRTTRRTQAQQPTSQKNTSQNNTSQNNTSQRRTPNTTPNQRPDQRPDQQPRAGQPRAGQPRAGQPRAGQPRETQPRAGQPRETQPRAGQPREKQPQERQPRERADQDTYHGPPLDPTITGHELDHTLTQHFRGLPEKLANRIARHLVAAALLTDTDPETAYQHTLAARARTPRIALVREACGEAAYTAGHYQQALTELRAAKRINGSHDYLHLIADCERALGHPQRALTLTQNPPTGLTPDQKAELTIVEAGARRDLGQLDAALRTLENAPLHTQTRAPWVTRLRYTYADTLQTAGHTQQALEWFHRTTTTDTHHTTNADQRAHQLEHPTNP